MGGGLPAFRKWYNFFDVFQYWAARRAPFFKFFANLLKFELSASVKRGNECNNISDYYSILYIL